MPIHDWTRIEAGMFHDFHLAWIAELRQQLNRGLLPEGYYVMAEQHTGPPYDSPRPEPDDSARTVTLTWPRVQRRLEALTSPKGKRRTLVLRHVSGHEIIALIEIVSPANKDRRASVIDFVNKMITALKFQIHVLLIDLLPPGRYDPSGMHGAVWERFGKPVPYDLPPDQPLSAAAYLARRRPRAFVNHLTVGGKLPAMPLFLSTKRFVSLPLAPSYDAAFEGMPAFWREVVEGVREPA
jgi:hypothetical protein